MTGTDEKPTLSPSLSVDRNSDRHCHFFLRGGKIDFCGDCFHDKAGQQQVEVELVPRFLFNEWDDEEELDG